MLWTLKEVQIIFSVLENFNAIAEITQEKLGKELRLPNKSKKGFVDKGKQSLNNIPVRCQPKPVTSNMRKQKLKDSLKMTVNSMNQ